MRFFDTSKNDGECSSMNGVTSKTFLNLFSAQGCGFCNENAKAAVNDKMC